MTTQHTDALRDGAVLEARMSAAFKDGRATAQDGEPRVNPWSGMAETAAERVLSKMWARGYSAGNPMPVPE